MFKARKAAMQQVPGIPKAPQRVIYRSKLTHIGQFRCPVGHPAFRCPSAVDGGHLMVFPRTSVIISQANRGSLIADPNTVVLYNNHQEYTRQANSPDGDRCEWFAFDNQPLIDAIRELEPSVQERPDRPFAHTHSGVRPSTYLTQRRLIDYITRNEHPDPLLVDECAMRVLREVVLAHTARGARQRAMRAGNRAKARRAQLAEAARKVIAREYRRNQSLSALARTLECSEYHLCRAFSTHAGISLHQYRDQLRLRSSLQWLADTREPLTSIALELGYSSHSHFSASFKRAFNITPSGYRRTVCTALNSRLHAQLGMPAYPRTATFEACSQ